MKAPRSKRSRRMWIAVLSVAVAMWTGEVLFDARDRLPQSVGIAMTLVWFSLFLTYVAARLNDTWALEARERRAAARRPHSPI